MILPISGTLECATYILSYLTMTSMTDTLRNIIGNRIKAIREDQGLSQRKFALMIRVHRNSIAKIERGETNLKLNTLEKIIDGLGVTPEEFFRGLR